jgi:hypothetical protein
MFRELQVSFKSVNNDTIVYQKQRLKSVPLGSSERLPKRNFSAILNLWTKRKKRFRRKESDLCGRLGRNPSIAQGREPIEASDCPTARHPPKHGDAGSGVRRGTGISP